MNQIIIIFAEIVAVILVCSLIVLWIATYLPYLLVKRFNKNARYDIDKFYFYYNKATAYRMLFTSFSVFGNVLQVLAIASTFITVYIAVNKSQYVVLSSLISATCEVVKLMLQPEKYTKAFSDAALSMEYVLLEECAPQELEKKLLEAYKRAEDIISKTK